jgi:RNA polymerase sigma-70 factor (ECF subfamily)
MSDASVKSQPQDDKPKRFMRLFLQSQRRLYGFILASIPNPHDADDLLQETNAVMWEKFDEFSAAGDPTTDFAAWGMKIARYKVLQHIDRRGRTATPFAPQTLTLIGDTMAKLGRDADAVHDALTDCLAKLPDRDRQIIRLRYEEDASTQSVAASIGGSVFTMYKRLNRIYGDLLGCIRHTLGWEGGRR